MKDIAVVLLFIDPTVSKWRQWSKMHVSILEIIIYCLFSVQNMLAIFLFLVNFHAATFSTYFLPIAPVIQHILYLKSLLHEWSFSSIWSLDRLGYNCEFRHIM